MTLEIPRVVNVCKDSKDFLQTNEVLQLKFSEDLLDELQDLHDDLVVIRTVDVFEDMEHQQIVKTINILRQKLSRRGVLHVVEPMNPRVNQILSKLICENGFPEVSQLDSREDMSYYLEDKESINGKYSIIATTKPSQHNHDPLLYPLQYKELINRFKSSEKLDVSWIITVHNEEKNLPHFLSYLEASMDCTDMRREFIFVVNGCTDKSEHILQEYSRQTSLDVQVIDSEIGILNAYKTGIAARKYDGFIGRFDADIFLHPYTLDLMQLHLTANPDAKVTYAEPLPLEAPNEFNAPYHTPEIATERLYYTGKTHLFRENIYETEGIKDMPKEFVADDIFVSFYFIYHFGFESISRTPSAVVYERVVSGFEELAMQFSRATSEIDRIMKKYPHFKVLDKLVEQKFTEGPYKNLTDKAKDSFQYVEKWTRLESTK